MSLAALSLWARSTSHTASTCALSFSRNPCKLPVPIPPRPIQPTVMRSLGAIRLIRQKDGKAQNMVLRLHRQQRRKCATEIDGERLSIFDIVNLLSEMVLRICGICFLNFAIEKRRSFIKSSVECDVGRGKINILDEIAGFLCTVLALHTGIFPFNR